VICTWSGASGSFKNGNVGPSVEYICINTSGSDSVEVTCVDAGTLAPDYWEPAYDCVTFTTVIPEIVEVNFQLASSAYNLKAHTSGSTVSSSAADEYWREVGEQDPICNHPAVFCKGSPLKLKFRAAAATDLTEDTDNITVSFRYGTGPGNQENETGGQTFDTSWPYQSPTMTSTSTFPNSISYEIAPGTDFRYKVTSGSNEWIYLQPDDVSHNLCVVAAAPVGGPHYEWVAWASCCMASGQQSDDARTIVNDIFDSLATYACADDWNTKLSYAFPDTGENYSVDSLLDDKSGSCGDWRFYFAALCAVQGIDENDGLKEGNFSFDPAGSAPWDWFRVEHKGINNADFPSAATSYDIVDPGCYPNTEDSEVNPQSKRWWVHAILPSTVNVAFNDHAVVFFDVAGSSTDYLYDPSFPPASGSPVVVTYPGVDGLKEYDGNSNFMTTYFNSSCPYVYGMIEVWEGESSTWEFLHVHSADSYNGDKIKINWDEE